LLTDVTLDFGALPVTDVYPAKIPDLFAGRPIVVTGRYSGTAKGTVHLAAKRTGDSYTRDIAVVLPVTDASNHVLPYIWAHNKLDNLMSQDWSGAQQQMKPAIQKQITQLGLDYGLMTQFTSFIAVEEKISKVNGRAQTIQVPVGLPQGIEMEQGWEGGSSGQSKRFPMFVELQPTPEVVMSVQSANTTVLAVPGISAKTAPLPLPPLPPAHRSSGVVGAGIGPGMAGGVAAADSDKLGAEKLSPQDLLLGSKLHPLVYANYDCWQKLADKSAAASCKVAGGKLAIEIITSGLIPPADLAAAGFEPDATQPIRNHVRGYVAVEKLPQLATLKEVQFIASVK
jgi:hypothetical protein